MFSLNGFKNIKNILIISFISLLLLSLFFCIKFFQKINTDSVISCDIKYLENNSYYPKSEIPLVLKICSDLQIDVMV